MDNFKLEGIWTGEYVYDEQHHASFTRGAVPFVMKIRVHGTDELFEGMCQDDPELSSIDVPAEIYGRLHGGDLIFNKRYPKTFFKYPFGDMIKADEPHPDVIYKARMTPSGKILGTWKIEETFRKIEGKIVHLGSLSGVWWMNRF